MSLLLEIARCRNAEHCLANPHLDHPCAQIVGSQRASYPDFQVPEPYSGDLHAPILFLGSNPSFAELEEYPRATWSDDEIADFFVHRFTGGRRPWVRDGLYILLRDGSHKANWVRYWAAIRQRAAELLGRPDVRPGIDYAMSEIVHCKSRGEVGVAAAAGECTERYLLRLVAESDASVIVSVGRFAAMTISRAFGIPEGKSVSGGLEIGRRQRHFTFLPHANARKARTFRDCLTDKELRLLQRTVKERDAKPPQEKP
jgi:hypothetical protein